MKKAFWGVNLSLAFGILVIAGCAHKSLILSATSHTDAESVTRIAQQKLQVAEGAGCRAVSISSGTGLGVVVPSDCKGCEALQDKQRAHDVYILVRCPHDVDPNTVGHP